MQNEWLDIGDFCIPLALKWRTLIYDWSPALLKFYLNAFQMTLPDQSNLVRWGKSTDKTCYICGKAVGTAKHLLVGCKVLLDSGQYSRRHDRVLEVIREAVNKYYELTNELTRNRFVVDLYAVEVGARGITAKSLYNLLKGLGLSRTHINAFLDRISKAALVGSFQIWLGRERSLDSGVLSMKKASNIKCTPCTPRRHATCRRRTRRSNDKFSSCFVNEEGFKHQMYAMYSTPTCYLQTTHQENLVNEEGFKHQMYAMYSTPTCYLQTTHQENLVNEEGFKHQMYAMYSTPTCYLQTTHQENLVNEEGFKHQMYAMYSTPTCYLQTTHQENFVNEEGFKHQMYAMYSTPTCYLQTTHQENFVNEEGFKHQMYAMYSTPTCYLQTTHQENLVNEEGFKHQMYAMYSTPTCYLQTTHQENFVNEEGFKHQMYAMYSTPTCYLQTTHQENLVNEEGFKHQMYAMYSTRDMLPADDAPGEVMTSCLLVLSMKKASNIKCTPCTPRRHATCRRRTRRSNDKLSSCLVNEEGFKHQMYAMYSTPTCYLQTTHQENFVNEEGFKHQMYAMYSTPTCYLQTTHQENLVNEEGFKHQMYAMYSTPTCYLQTTHQENFVNEEGFKHQMYAMYSTPTCYLQTTHQEK
ncbi:unnamed protein product [Danaus chrysippus]|uniref:(African queen) hypothetical protein n=1 Tax=Danaus chrysippus TaxID=151541 RepID=A0A8J2WAM6_9NEOP|nr:unnamed protein product [Danaus chrysippus]